MRVGLDIRTLMDARYSGVSEYTLNLIREILKLADRNEYRLFYNSFGACLNLPEFSEKNVRLVKYNYPNKIFNYLLIKIFGRPQIDKALAADVFFMPHINFIGLAGAAKTVITIHDLSFLRYPEFFSRRQNFWHKMVNVKKLLQKFDLVVAVSENTKRDIVELCGMRPDKVKVVYSGVGGEYRKIFNFQFSIFNEIQNSKFKIQNLNADERRLVEVKSRYNLPDKFILYLGTLEPRKNVEGIIKAFNALRDYKLVIAGGEGWKSANIFKEWEKSEYKDDIKFLGYVENDEKVYLYNLASVFIYPSFYEGFGLPPLEAMASGTAVITSYASSLSEVAGGAALMVDPYNINELAEALKSVLTDEKLKNDLIERGLKQAEKFNWGKTAAEYLKIFNELKNA